MPPPEGDFESACARNAVRPEHRKALRHLLETWPTSAADPLQWIMEEYRHWLLYERSRAGDASASAAFERYWRDAARAYLGRGFTREQVEELGALFFERVYERATAFAWATPWTAYLRTILLNVAREEIRQLRRRRGREVPIDELDGRRAVTAPDPAPSAEEQVLEGEREAALARALRALSADDRLLLTAFVLEGKPADTIAALLGIRRDAVYQRLKRARERLRALVEEAPVRSRAGRHLP